MVNNHIEVIRQEALYNLYYALCDDDIHFQSLDKWRIQLKPLWDCSLDANNPWLIRDLQELEAKLDKYDET